MGNTITYTLLFWLLVATIDWNTCAAHLQSEPFLIDCCKVTVVTKKIKDKGSVVHPLPLLLDPALHNPTIELMFVIFIDLALECSDYNSIRYIA